MSLDLRTRTYHTPRGHWSIAARHTRIGGDIDAILAFTPHNGTDPPRLYGYRQTLNHTTGGRHWQQTIGTWTDITIAARSTAAATTLRPLSAPYLAQLLNLTIAMQDFPLLVQPSGEWISTREAADLLELHADTVRNMAIRGELVARQLQTTRWQISGDSVRALLADRAAVS